MEEDGCMIMFVLAGVFFIGFLVGSAVSSGTNGTTEMCVKAYGPSFEYIKDNHDKTKIICGNKEGVIKEV